MTRKAILDDLWKAMSGLYAARYKATGPEGPDKNYPEMDRETFDEIATLQTKLQSLISRLEKASDE